VSRLNAKRTASRLQSDDADSCTCDIYKMRELRVGITYAIALVNKRDHDDEEEGDEDEDEERGGGGHLAVMTALSDSSILFRSASDEHDANARFT
jgi:hypothetical protein